MSHVNSNGEVALSSFRQEGNLVYPVTHNLVDLFWGKGFTNQARFKWNGKEWELWEKAKSLPKNYEETLTFYRASLKGE